MCNHSLYRVKTTKYTETTISKRDSFVLSLPVRSCFLIALGIYECPWCKWLPRNETGFLNVGWVQSSLPFLCCCWVTQLCLTQQHSWVKTVAHRGTFQARILEWVAISSPGHLLQGWNASLQHWQVDSFLLSLREGPLDPGMEYYYGFPWWLSRRESACQRRRRRLDPWSGRIPQRGNGSSL